MANVELSFAIGSNPRSEPVLSGRVRPQGIDLHCSNLHGSETFWRQLAYKEFEVSEMSMSSFLIATSRGDESWVGLPVFTSRMFFHLMILVRDAAGIDSPEKLAGKRVGVPEYQQTAALWSRGILQHEFGVAPESIHWFMERPPEKSHGGATGFTPPEGVRLEYIPPTSDIGSMLSSGELDATLLYLPEANLVDRSRAQFGPGSGVSPLFPDKRAEAARYFEKTGIFPINHCVVVRRDVVERYPWVMLNLYSAFLEAKQLAHAELLARVGPYVEAGLCEPGEFARDLFVYGVKDQRDLLETITEYSHEQGLTRRKVGLEEIFYPPTLEL